MLSDTVALKDIQSQLLEIVSMVAKGNTVVITEHDKPFAKIVPMEKRQSKRVAGLNRGKVWISDDFDEPLPAGFWAEKHSCDTSRNITKACQNGNFKWGSLNKIDKIRKDTSLETQHEFSTFPGEAERAGAVQSCPERGEETNTPEDTPVSPLDVPTVEADISTEELVRIIRDGRGRGDAHCWRDK